MEIFFRNKKFVRSDYTYMEKFVTYTKFRNDVNNQINPKVNFYWHIIYRYYLIQTLFQLLR